MFKHYTTVKLLSTVLLLSLGVLALLLSVLFWQGRQRDYAPQSEAFNGALTSLLPQQEQTEQPALMRKGPATWQAYYKNVHLATSFESEDLQHRIEGLAQSKGLRTAVESSGTHKTLSVFHGDKLFARVLLLTALQKPEQKKPAIAIVIDDVGYKKDLSSFLDLGIPITFAILPFERATRDIAAQLTELNMPYLLHLPMEPDSYPSTDPGKAALLVSMPDAQIIQKLTTNLENVPGVAGVSNHMGSRFTSNADKMAVVLNVLREKQLFFFDSYTSPKTQVKKIALKTGLPVLENELFLDLKDDPDFMRKQCAVLLANARRDGRAIAIGHVQKKHMAAALKEFIPQCKEAGVEFVYLTDLFATQGENKPQ